LEGEAPAEPFPRMGKSHPRVAARQEPRPPENSPRHGPDLSLERPVVRRGRQALPNRVHSDVLELLHVVVPISHLSVPAVREPPPVVRVKTPCRAGLQVRSPSLDVNRRVGSRTAEEVDVVRHDQVVAGTPRVRFVGGKGERSKESLVRQNLRTWTDAERHEYDDGTRLPMHRRHVNGPSTLGQMGHRHYPPHETLDLEGEAPAEPFPRMGKSPPCVAARQGPHPPVAIEERGRVQHSHFSSTDQ